jgi:hypothetical protein
MTKLPYIQLFTGDLIKDPGYRALSYAARGLWLDMLCLMHESDRRGYLQLNGKPIDATLLARMTGGLPDEVSRLLQELEDSGVFSRTTHGMIYNRRMADKEKERKAAARRQENFKSKKKAESNGQGNGQGNG